MLRISIKHVTEMVEVCNRNVKLLMKLNKIREYNLNINRSDQMLSYYTFLRKTIRWPTQISLHITEMYIYICDAHERFHKTTYSQMKLIKFTEAFVGSLVEEIEPI